MRASGSVERERSSRQIVDGCFFAFSAVAACWFAYVLLRDGVQHGWQSLLLVVFWIFFTYLVLPRLHRILTLLYIPGYFVGRARTSDGLLGDPVNVALLGRPEQVHAALRSAGWIRADEVSVRSSWQIVESSVRRRSYPTAPVSPLHLFDRAQDFSYQQEVDGSPSRRHHVRFWRCPEGWMLPGGFEVDYLAAATFDRRVGLSLFTLQITHKIDPHTDAERDFVVGTVTAAEPEAQTQVIRNFSSGYHSRNGGGDRIETDGHLPVVDLRSVTAPAQSEDAIDARGQRPPQVVLGTAIAVARGISYVVIAALALLAPQVLDLAQSEDTGVSMRTIEIVLVCVALVAAALDLTLAVAVYLARNWARLALMAACAAMTVVSFSTALGSKEPVSVTSLPAVGGGILILLALSSRSAREFATRKAAR